MARPRNGSGVNLQDALAQLVQNQAALLAQHTLFISHLDEDRLRFSRIERDLEVIKALLVKHEDMLQKMPDAIKEKIGFKQ